MSQGASGVVTDRASAITGFAEALRELRQDAGNPSFREMSGRSRAISHTTLHEAAQGNRLPSWATTVEFVKACGGDPDEYRGRWEAANRVVHTGGPTADATPDPAARSAEPAAPAPEAEAAPPVDPPEILAPDEPGAAPHRRWFALAGAAAVVAVIAGVLVAVLGGSGDTDPSGSPAQQVARADDARRAVTAPNCPIQQPQPKPAPPAHRGDHARFVGDITVPDCQHVERGAQFTKIWRLKNIGTVTWSGYTLRRLDLPAGRGECQTITDLPVSTTAPGQMVDIRTEVTAPQAAGFCFVRFHMVDSAGRVVFPGGRPLNFQVIVD